MLKFPFRSAFFLLCLAAGAQAQDQGNFGAVIRIEQNAFSPDAGYITFSENPVGAKNPFYMPEDYGAPPSGVQVMFGGFFQGQSIGSTSQCPPGANRSGCVVGKPIAPLRLDPYAPTTLIAKDRSNPTSPSLSGTPLFDGPVSMLFSQDVAGVGLEGGYFNRERSTAILAFDRDGRMIGGVKNITIGMEYLALVTEDGGNRIAGIQFSLVGDEPAGYAIDNLSFATAKQIVRDQVKGIAEALGERAQDVAEPPSLNSLFSDLGGEANGEGEGAADDGGAPRRGGPSSLEDLFRD